MRTLKWELTAPGLSRKPQCGGVHYREVSCSFCSLTHVLSLPLEVVDGEGHRQGVRTHPLPVDGKLEAHLPTLRKPGRWHSQAGLLVVGLILCATPTPIWWVRLGISWGGRKASFLRAQTERSFPPPPPTSSVTLQVIWLKNFYFLTQKMQTLIEPTPGVVRSKWRN